MKCAIQYSIYRHCGVRAWPICHAAAPMDCIPDRPREAISASGSMSDPLATPAQATIRLPPEDQNRGCSPLTQEADAHSSCGAISPHKALAGGDRMTVCSACRMRTFCGRAVVLALLPVVDAQTQRPASRACARRENHRLGTPAAARDAHEFPPLPQPMQLIAQQTCAYPFPLASPRPIFTSPSQDGYGDKRSSK